MTKRPLFIKVTKEEHAWEEHEAILFVRILHDPFRDMRTAYVFFVNPRGARGEGLAYAGESSLNWDGVWEAESRRLEGGLGVECALSPRTFPFIEGMGRYARFENFPSATMDLEDYEGENIEETGKIYLETDTVPQGALTHFIVSDAEPVPDPGQTYREPKFDFSGFALQIGLRIRL